MKAGSTLVSVMAVCWLEGGQQEHSRGYPTHSDFKFVRQSGDSTCCAAIHEQHSRGVFQQDNARPNTPVVTQYVLQSADMLPWPSRSPDLSPIDHVWHIFGRQLQHHPQLALTVSVITDQVQQAWNSIPQTDIRHLYDAMHARLHACSENSGGYTDYQCTSISHLKYLFSRLH
ncbi:hypothetical protein AVEN_83882-1 [Araneus ventricosus]|uniref:Tc1-like transposase DDE domain-containing protein n=1 Tax=Araneus ventricosus TaxID=182803 RepID=A0A4Y2FWC9_ARAVE|nr:hypothetical protein AVEN_83882-1 [Araneus ventricosus]